MCGRVVKKFKIPCDFSGKSSGVTFYIGKPESDHHPIHFQADWLSRERGGSVPDDIMNSLEELKDLAEKHDVSFEDLCSYALKSIQSEEKEEDKND